MNFISAVKVFLVCALIGISVNLPTIVQPTFSNGATDRTIENVHNVMLGEIFQAHWKEMLSRYKNQTQIVFEFKNLEKSSEIGLLYSVSKQVNVWFKYVDDAVNFDKNEYWATPQEYVQLGSGDCEDNAILKYFALKQYGIPADRMVIAIVSTKETKVNGSYHAVLLVKLTNGEIVVLNNGRTSPMFYLKDALAGGWELHVTMNERGIYIHN